MAIKHWMQAESRREKHAGTKGSFKRLAERHGHSTREEAQLDKHKPGLTGQRARLALSYMSAKHG